MQTRRKRAHRSEKEEKRGAGTPPARMLAAEARAELLEQAREIARSAFRRPGRAHILAVFERLAWNRCHGLGQAGATTLH